MTAASTSGSAGAPAAAAANRQEVADVLEERLIDAEYKIWKKNTPFLYDFVLTHALEWPSLTCQFLPTVRKAGDTAEELSLLLGTHTTGEQNYLMMASCVIPTPEDVIESNTAEGTTAASYDEEKQEMGGFGRNPNSIVGKIEVRMKVKHEGEVNRARHMPQNHFIVATRGPNPEVYVWDISKHPSFPADNAPFAPQGVCVGHAKEGYGLCWSPHQAGYLLSGSEDNTLCLWDVQNVIGKGPASNAPGTQIQPKTILRGHTDVVEDVDWHYKDPNMVGSVSDDKTVRLWDIRKTEPVHLVQNAHDNDINCIAFNPEKEFLLATGSADKTVAIWDMRNLKSKLHNLQGHTDQVYKIEWAPHNESILASCSADRRVGIWDLSRIGQEQSEEDAEDGPPELLFLHGGHTSKVSDFSWSAKSEWTVASVSEDNILQVWNMAEEIYAADDDEEEMSSGAGEDRVLADDDLEE
ncbi:Probable histone-binding protein lin-53 [Seminavis robusta]|uniref:Probable histone-binding protein lin-53 n=1 Tax=Seminavis robusta TaxID=568900 RepID=A0A9N8H198_9STRA|nr:Probable histone-binding protein lin-53 [Seminavis robusta]|eukprot:Sro1_g000700.1 Probable histone-binding protein lin-53 (467) ;mRNA; r:199023-200518